MPLVTTPNFHRPGETARIDTTPGDTFYAALMALHRGLTDAESTDANARLILLLANHIGDLDVLDEALRLARLR